ncbi:MAG: hypothetical protein ACREQN_13930 [Candidatus Binataceae bacterium]
MAGLVIGFAGSTLAYRYRLLSVPGEGPIQRMRSMLNLTPAQQEQIGEVMEKTRFKVLGLHSQFRRERRTVLVDAYGQIRGLLTPGQQQKFDREFVPPNLREQLHLHGLKPRSGAAAPSPQPGTAPKAEGAPGAAAHP